jgi:hypothetical protein
MSQGEPVSSIPRGTSRVSQFDDRDRHSRSGCRWDMDLVEHFEKRIGNDHRARVEVTAVVIMVPFPQGTHLHRR